MDKSVNLLTTMAIALLGPAPATSSASASSHDLRHVITSREGGS